MFLDHDPQGYCVTTELTTAEHGRVDAGGDGRLRVLVAVDSDVVRLGLCSMLDTLPTARQVDCNGPLDVALKSLQATDCDVVIASALLDDDRLARLNELAQRSGAKLMLLLPSPARDSLSPAAAQAADGFMLEAALTCAALEEALRRLRSGDVPVPPELARELLAKAHSTVRVPQQRVYLTQREKQALKLLVEGLSNRQIAARMSITEHGAKRHVANVLAKLNSPNRTLAAAKAVSEGLLDE
ncbi:response regulator transcription factor [Streptomyces chiangmaiensis]|uniref:Response regulator transcription factor n=1 Tax=Streptomyces chiangmaiensis TaxID=766497 RepID=A0ABU7FLQ5_9ACTN|nr:response regulator transcription factor [Streptomyces chiangmaiensis]MED7825042.1 response regulator transcription factor [Streptomyces chiangmaiensis]